MPVLLAAAEQALGWLLAFAGPQRHVRLRHVAIRHWDGYWFGLRRQWGDTFPPLLVGADGRGPAGPPGRAGARSGATGWPRFAQISPLGCIVGMAATAICMMPGISTDRVLPSIR